MKIVDNVLIKVTDLDIPADGRFIIPDAVKAIGPNAFESCQKLISVSIPPGVTCIEKATFYKCSNLRSVSLPKGLTAIADSAFSGCRNLLSLTIHRGMTTIGNLAFFECDTLATITIPQGVTITASTFINCPKLSIIIIDADNPYALELVKNQLPPLLICNVFSTEEYALMQQMKSSVLMSMFKELPATNQIMLLSKPPLLFFSLLPAELLKELNKYTTYASALLKLPDLNIPVSRDEQGTIDWFNYQIRFKSLFTYILRIMLTSPLPEQAQATSSDISFSLY